MNSKEGLPAWFLDEEAKYYKPNIPITKEAVAALRAKQRALDARPIKKVAEAKARKKFKAAQRLEKAMKKAEGVNAMTDMSEREKAQQIEKVMRKGLSAGRKAKKEVKVVVAKGAHKGVKGRPKGVKGRYTMVDSRMRKEVSPLSSFIRPAHLFCRFAPKRGRRKQIKSENGRSRCITFIYPPSTVSRNTLSRGQLYIKGASSRAVCETVVAVDKESQCRRKAFHASPDSMSWQCTL